MSAKRLNGKKVLMVIAPKNFRDEELFAPKSILEEAGAVVKIAAKSLNPANGMLGGLIKPNLLLNSAAADDYDAIVVVGGSGSPEFLWPDNDLRHLLHEADAQGKIIGAICLAGVALARAGLLAGRQATVYKTKDSLKEYERAGVSYTNEEVVTDGRYVTASGPQVATAFGQTIAKLLQ